MAYGNYGAFVYKDGSRQKNREDNTPYLEDELEAGYWQAFAGNNEKKLDCVHASLGSGRVRLCAYKNSPRLYLDGKLLEIEKNSNTYLEDEIFQIEAEGEIEGYKFSISQYADNMIQLELVDPDGTKWTATCGYAYGAGHMDDDI